MAAEYSGTFVKLYSSEIHYIDRQKLKMRRLLLLGHMLI